MRLPRVPAHEARSRTASFSIVFERLQAAKSVLCIVCGCKDSARRAQRKRKAERFSFCVAEPPPPSEKNRIHRRKEAKVHWESRHPACCCRLSRQDACSPSAPTPPLTLNKPCVVMGHSINQLGPDAGFTASGPRWVYPIYIRVYTPVKILQPFSRPFIPSENHQETG